MNLFLYLLHRPAGMKFLEPIASSENQALLDSFIEHAKNGKPVFLFLYLDNCNPCNATKENWKEIPNFISDDNKKSDVMVAQINQELYGIIQKKVDIGIQPESFPTLRYIRGKNIEEYDSDRSAKGLATWIESTLEKQSQKGGATRRRHKRRKRRTHKRRKTSKRKRRRTV